MPNPSILPLIYKQAGRYSVSKRPAPGERCIFSHATILTTAISCSQSKAFDREEIYQNAFVTVVRNRPHLIEATFDGAKHTDLISPEFLIKAELTKFGEAMLASNASADLTSILRRLQ